MDTASSTSSPAPPDLSSTPASPQDARAAQEQLRAQRAQGLVSQDHYLQRTEFYQRIIAGEKAEAPNLYPTQEQRFEQQLAAHMAVPKPEHYGPIAGNSLQPEIDTAVRTAFSAAGVPSHLATPLVEAVQRTSALLRADEAAVELRCKSVEDRLRQQWGSDFDSRFAAIGEVIRAMGKDNPRVAAIFERAPWIFHADEAAMEYLHRVAAHRTRTAGAS